ncbi:hypothetical protein G6F42_020228 [Rhizopus arrhizus]|nr:hypothetical protein G6F42_020228 [Rhizopus arrhizus]
MSNKHVRLSIQQKIELLDKHGTGHDNQMELGEWVKQAFNLSKVLCPQTISDTIKNSENIYSNVIAKNNGKSLKLPQYSQLDQEVTKYASQKNAANRPADRRTITYIKHVAAVNASVDITSENIQNEIKRIQSLLKDYPPEDILNFDETGLYYEQAPRRTICSEPFGGLKKSKKRLTVGLLCNADGTYKGHPIVVGQSKHPKCFDKQAKLLAKTAVGNSHHVEYYHSPNAWMTAEIFTMYIRKLDVAFRRQGRNVALLLDNASVHKTKLQLTNIKLVFLPANTTSKLQALDAGIIANFKAHFRATQYDRALTQYLTGQLENPYEMDQVQAMIYIASSWKNVKPETIANCWRHTNMLSFKDKPTGDSSDDFELPQFPTCSLPLEQTVVDELNRIIPDLPGNTNNEVTRVSELDLETDEDSMLLMELPGLTTDDDFLESTVGNKEFDEEEPVNVNESKKRFREACEDYLKFDVPQ